MNDVSKVDALSVRETESEIIKLERHLAEARDRLKELNTSANGLPESRPHQRSLISDNPSHHFLLLLSDSALPLGSFAFSSGLESYLAHTVHIPPTKSFATFLPESISSFASTNLPFALAAYDDPASLAELDDTLDASTICTVGRRASTAQGRALLSLWEKSLAPPLGDAALTSFALEVKKSGRAAGDEVGRAHGHLAPVFGAVGRAAGLSRERMAYVLVLGHVKALVSAAVRAGVLGPYKAQGVLAGDEVRRMVGEAVHREWETRIEDAGQTVPATDLWIGRHEVLYSRIFNS
ncbi:hypothetical protein jhhlp_006592 [Lomentospora prolificans]|uniref:Urease accessory protein UreF n=1 Tax=Lomentospora prolificans TaxID=41688 RepID=A0A2N3N6A8_9PEZI|nr:hypothetical protein jhhlp_006592 [Lomentospora prolificans]